MPVASDFDSFIGGWDLTSAAYSGGAGGDFANLVAGGDAWSVAGATPVFETRQGLEGMRFTNVASESVMGRMPMLHEGTVIVVADSDDGTELGMLGGAYGSGNSWAMRLSSNKLQTFCPPASAAESGSIRISGQINVMTSSWHPSSGTLHAQMNDGAVGTSTNTKKDARITWAVGAIGRHRTTYFKGWITRVLMFDRALHVRDNAGLQALITDELARPT